MQTIAFLFVFVHTIIGSFHCVPDIIFTCYMDVTDCKADVRCAVCKGIKLLNWIPG